MIAWSVRLNVELRKLLGAGLVACSVGHLVWMTPAMGQPPPMMPRPSAHTKERHERPKQLGRTGQDGRAERWVDRLVDDITPVNRAKNSSGQGDSKSSAFWERLKWELSPLGAEPSVPIDPPQVPRLRSNSASSSSRRSHHDDATNELPDTSRRDVPSVARSMDREADWNGIETSRRMRPLGEVPATADSVRRTRPAIESKPQYEVEQPGYRDARRDMEPLLKSNRVYVDFAAPTPPRPFAAEPEAAPEATPRRLPEAPSAQASQVASQRRVEAALDRLSIRTPGAVLDAARETCNLIHNYQARVVWQRRVDGRLLPKGTAVIRCRIEPYAVYIGFHDDIRQGEHWVYPSDEYGQVVVRKPTDIGQVLSYLPISDPHLAQHRPKNITDWGVQNVLDELEQKIERERLGAGCVDYLGLGESEGAKLLHHVRALSSTGHLRTDYYLDGNHFLPVLVVCYDSVGELVEYVKFEDLELNVPELNDADAFDARVLFHKR